jgi:hypothetical protein
MHCYHIEVLHDKVWLELLLSTTVHSTTMYSDTNICDCHALLYECLQMLKVREELERTFKAALLELSGTYKATAFEVNLCYLRLHSFDVSALHCTS